MRRLAFHFASGDALFSGCALLLAACLLGWRVRTRPSIVRVLALLGGVFVAASATPLPAWFYVVWLSALAAWLIVLSVVDRGTRPDLQNAAKGLALLTASFCLLAMGLELPYRGAAMVPNGDLDTLVVIGDSISAGIDGGEVPSWPDQLRDQHHVRVVNYSVEAATAASALQQALQVDQPHALVLIEIGGNNLLAGKPADTFAADLERLLNHLNRPRRRLAMLELPLPPFYNEYGRVQRILAARFGVTLIPKREFTNVLAPEQATIDGLHLTPDGRRRMADMIWRHVGRGLAIEKGMPRSSQ